MIQYKVGDVIKALQDSEIDVLAHGVNCQNSFGRGVAGQIAKEYPIAKVSYHNFFLERTYRVDPEYDGIEFLDKIDEVHVAGDKVILNCFTQQYCGYGGKKYVSYDAIEACFKKALEYCKDENLKIGIPKIGAGLAGGSWNIIETIINEVFGEYPITVYKLKENK